MVINQQSFAVQVEGFPRKTIGIGTREKSAPKAPVGAACLLRELKDMDNLAELVFAEAFKIWFQTHKPFIADRTAGDYEQYGAALCEFLGATKIGDIGHRGVQAYQIWRSREQGTRQPGSYAHRAGNVRIRNEINGVLKPILKEAGLWEEIKRRKFRHLPCPIEGSGTLITKEEQREILGIAAGKRRWLLLFHCQRIMYRSGCGGGELFKVRRRDVNLDAATMDILVGAKNHRRVRTLRLVPLALESMRWIMARADQLGATDPDDYILPHRSQLRDNGRFDRPMRSLYHSWIAVRREWIRQYPHRKNKAHARFIDARGSAATYLMSNPRISQTMVEKVLGWRPGSRMRQRYNAADQEMMREALDTLEDAEPERKPPRKASDQPGKAAENAG